MIEIAYATLLFKSLAYEVEAFQATLRRETKAIWSATKAGSQPGTDQISDPMKASTCFDSALAQLIPNKAGLESYHRTAHMLLVSPKGLLLATHINSLKSEIKNLIDAQPGLLKEIVSIKGLGNINSKALLEPVPVIYETPSRIVANLTAQTLKAAPVYEDLANGICTDKLSLHTLQERSDTLRGALCKCEKNALQAVLQAETGLESRSHTGIIHKDQFNSAETVAVQLIASSYPLICAYGDTDPVIDNHLNQSLTKTNAA